MTGKQLRNSILQWAIQGKLVPQDPNDEPASVLLERIREEKVRLVKEKKIKRDKNETIIYRGEDNSYYEKTLATGSVKCIDDEIPFDIPESWSWCRLRNVCTVFGRIGFRGYTKSDIVEQGNGAITISPSNMIENGEMNFNCVSYISWFKYDESPEIQIAVNDILIVKTGSSYGKTCVITSLPEKATINPQIAVLKYNFINPEILCYILSSPLCKEQFEKYVIGTSIPTFSQEKLSSTLIPLPPILEQKRMACVIRDIFSRINTFCLHKEQLNTLENRLHNSLRNSILQEAIRGRLVPQIESEGTAEELLEEIRAEKQRLFKEDKLKKSAIANKSRIFRGDDNKYYEQIGSTIKEISEEIPFDIPTSWQWCRIESIFQINPKNDVEDDTEVAFVPMEAIKPGYGSSFTFQLTKWKNIKRGYTHFADGDIAFAKITPCFQNRKSVIFHNLPSGIGAGTTELKVLRPMVSQISPEYILAFLQSSYFIDEATFKGTANQQRIISGYDENKLFPLPPIEEQRRIAHRLQELFELTL